MLETVMKVIVCFFFVAACLLLLYMWALKIEKMIVENEREKIKLMSDLSDLNNLNDDEEIDLDMDLTNG